MIILANTYYSNEFKKMATELVLIGKESTTSTAKRLNIPLKTFEKWITAYNKNNRVFDSDYISPEEQIKKLKKQNKILKIISTAGIITVVCLVAK